MPHFRKNYKKPWSASVHISREKKTYHLGYFLTKEEAAAAEEEFRKTKHMPGRAWPESAREKSKAVRAAKLPSTGIGTRTPNTKWRKPEPMPEGDTREARQERARIRAAKAIK